MSTNDGGHIIDVAIHSASEEMAALEQLGPVTRSAIANSPIRYAALPVLKQIKDFCDEQLKMVAPEMREMYRRGRFNPQNPELDSFIAKGLIEDARKTILKDRSEHDAQIGVVPLVPKITVKTLREQRRVARKVRW